MVDRHGITWETNEWYSNIVARPFKTADEYAIVLENKINQIEQSIPDYPETKQLMFLDDDLLMAPVKEFKKIFNNYLELLDGTVLIYPDISPGLDHLYTMGGWEIFTEMFFDKQEILVAYMEALTKLHVERAHAIADVSLSPCVLIACDIAHKEGPLVSPKFLNEHYFLRVKQIVDAYHEYDMKVFYHSEGNLWPILDDLVATGIDGLNPCEPHSHMDVKDVRAKYPKLVLWGGVDNSFMLIYDLPETVRERVEELKDFGREGEMLIGSTGQIHPACKLENLISMIETVHGHKII
jgi:uroporphyrinogen decarboxylase